MKISRPRRLSGARLYFLFFLLLVAAGSQACGGGHALVRRDTAELGLGSPIAWFGPASTNERATLGRWRMSVGPPIVQTTVAADPGAHDALTIVSWNTAVGEGDIVRFVRSLPQSDAPLVLLLQEVFRDGPEVPAPSDRDSAFTRQLGSHRAEASNREIDDAARALNLNVYYVPSMRNGDLSSAEDRGNAILSSLPLDELRAMELPFERQRRVAVAATLRGRTSNGDTWRLRVVSAHLDNLGGIKRGWIGSEYGRARQARSLTEVLRDDESTILAGDFNTWFGFSDQAYVETARAFPDTRVTDRRATFRGLLRLDHIFVRLVPGWHLDFHRASSRFGSDHYPLIGTLRFH